MSPAIPRICQVAMCSADLARAVRRFEAIGFVDSGARLLTGGYGARLQGLGTDMTALIWWLVGSQPMTQLEVFQHSQPRLRRKSNGQRPSDLGWAGWGVAVPDLDRAVAALRANSVTLEQAHPADGGLWFLDPDTAVYIALREEPATTADQAVLVAGAPRITHATLSVPDLGLAEQFYTIAFKLLVARQDTEPIQRTHGVARSLTLRGSNDLGIEIVEYLNPRGRPRAADARLSDQGMMNVAISYEDDEQRKAAIIRALDAGATADYPLRPGDATAYIRDPFGNSVEVATVPFELAAELGYLPRPPFPPRNRIGRPA